MGVTPELLAGCETRRMAPGSGRSGAAGSLAEDPEAALGALAVVLLSVEVGG